MRSERFLIEYGEQHISLSGTARHSGKNLIALLHGFGCTNECFEQIFDNTALDEMSILALDFPGHGDSGRLCDTSMYSLQAFADIANAVIDLLSPEQVTFVGHSMGGAVSLIASQARHDVYGIVNADGNLVAQDCGVVSRETADQTLDRFLEHGYHEFLTCLRESEELVCESGPGWTARVGSISRGVVG
jgi:pimeloyl-ACP methyl ester carboxylesterase